MEVKRLDAGEAIRWIADHWRVPLRNMKLTTNKWGTEKRIYAAHKPKPLPDALKPSVGLLARSRGWSELRSSTQKLAMVILGKIKPGDNPVLTTTQEELRATAAIASRGTMQVAMRELHDIELITTQRVAPPVNYSSHFTSLLSLRLERGGNKFHEWINGKAGYWLWVYRPFIHLTHTLRVSLDVQSLDVQKRVLIQEIEHPNSENLSEVAAGNPYTDKELVQNLFGMLDERGWLDRTRP